MARSELDAWRAEHPHATARPEDFAPIREGLRTVKLAEIMSALGVSKASASSWRSGRVLPALRHWEALGRLAGVEVPAGAEVVDLERERHYAEKARDDHEHDAAAAMLTEDAETAEPVAAVARLAR